MIGKEYKELVNKLGKCNKRENINGLDIFIKDIPDSNREGILDPRVLARKLQPKNEIKQKDKTMFGEISIGEIRQGMGCTNIDISKDKIIIEERVLYGRSGEFRIKIYRPESVLKDLPCIIFIHGGAFIGGSTDVVENPCKALAERLYGVVVSVDYRLAPEFPYPTGLMDCYYTMEYVKNNHEALGINVDNISIAGDSAGGNLALISSIMNRDEKVLKLKSIILLYPLLTLCERLYEWNIDQYYINEDREIIEKSFVGLKKTLDLIDKLYLQGKIEPENKKVSPLAEENLKGLPPVLIVTGEFDYLRIQGEEFSKNLILNHVKLKHIRYRGMDHAFLDKCGIYPQAEDCINEIVKWIKG